MLSRYNVFRLLMDQVRSVKDRRGSTSTDKSSLIATVFIPVVLGLVSWQLNWTLDGGADLLLAFSSMTGILLAVFALIAGWRERLARRVSLLPESERVDRDRLDEAARHTLVAALTCLVGSGLSVIASATARGEPPQTNTLVAALCYASLALVGLLMVMVIVLTYDAYTESNQDIEREQNSQLSNSVRNAIRASSVVSVPDSPISHHETPE